jgi:diguanylate cyclase (GGDEF)-like protein
MVPIERDGHVRRARRTAALTRAAIGVVGVALVIAKPGLLPHQAFGLAGFTLIVGTALVHVFARRISALKVEESLAAGAAVLIVGFGYQRVNVLSILWLAAVASGVMARGGRVHWIGRTVVLGSLALPVLREGRLSAEHAGLIVATITLLLTIGRLTLELNNLLHRARWDADHDGLTGVLSRNAFRRALERASGSASERSPVSLLLLDLDGFGAINKTSGHAAGDRLLAALGELLCARAGEHGFAGRLGGDEFAIVVPGTDGPALAGELLAELPHETGDTGGVQRQSASIGVARAPRDGGDAEALLRAGDIALRVAKRAPGDGQVSAYSAGSLSGAGRESARGALARAIDGDELTIVVQPIFDVRSGAIHAYEALARFGADGAGSPLQWLALADELGERDALERACLRAALELFCRRPPNASLSVNVSATVLLDPRTRKMLDRLPDLSGLIVEITEEAVAHGGDRLDAAIAPLRERGAKMAVDDMGAGYSGLAQILAVRPSYLKLDRSLVKGIDGDRGRAAMVAALVGYAESVDSLLVAEGMETAAELRTLVELGVPLAQGFYLARPGKPWTHARAVSRRAATAGSAPRRAPQGSASSARRGSTTTSLRPARSSG